MATHDYIISNGTGAAVRADLNNALAAIVSNNSNSSEPATKYAYQWWADTSNAVMKIRNSANDGWIELFQLDGTITLEDGSASTPALAFRDDLNTGIFSGGANEINISTNGSERFVVNANGRCGIGATDASTAQLVVYRQTVNSGNPVLEVRSNHDTTNSVKFSIDGDGEGFFSDRVGFGNTSPNAVVTISESTTLTGGDINVNADALVIDNSAGNTGLTFKTPTSATSRIAFGDPDDNNIGQIRYDHSADSLIFDVNVSPRMTIDSAGRVRIANTDLTLSSLADNLVIGTTSGDNGLTIFSGTGSTGNIFFADTSTAATGNRMGTITYDHSNNFMRFSTNGNEERFRVDSSGRFMLGLTSPLDTTASSLNITGLTSGARIATQGTTTSANANLTEFFAHWTTNKVAGFIIKSGTDTTNKDDGSMHFSTNDGSGLSEALTILNNQKVGVNNTSPTEVLHVTGNILASGTITPSSDIAFKKDVKPLKNVLDKVTQLIGINFTYKNNNEKSMGLIAQDVEKFFPELIRGEEGSKSLNYMGLTGALVEAIKELSAKVAALEAA